MQLLYVKLMKKIWDPSPLLKTKFLLFSYVPKMAAVVRPALLLNKASRGQCNDASACVTPCITSLALLILNRSDCRPMSPLWAHYGNLVKKDYRALDHCSPVEFCVPIAKWAAPTAAWCARMWGAERLSWAHLLCHAVEDTSRRQKPNGLLNSLGCKAVVLGLGGHDTPGPALAGLPWDSGSSTHE